MDIYLDILSVVAEGLAEDGQSSHMLRVVVHGKAETETAAVIELETVDRHVRDFQAVYEGAFSVDDKKLEQPVLVPVGEPPVGSEKPSGIAEISGGEPVPDTDVVQVKGDVGGPYVVDAGRLGGKLRRDRKLRDLLEAGDEVGDIVFHKALGKPEDIRAVTVRMVKIAGIVHLTDDGLIRGEAAGRTDPVDGIVAHLDIRAVDIQNIFLPFQIDQNFVQMNRAYLLVAVACGFTGNGYQPAAFQFLDMAGQRAVCDIQAGSQFVHAHAVVVQKNI